jgi:poly-gamma-glutamate synthesis protein (capsule biosynthesis protein)
VALLLLAGCGGFADWPDPATVYPHVYTPRTDLEPYEEVRWETETWSPDTDPGQAGLYLRKAQLHRPSAPTETLEHCTTMRSSIPSLGPGPRLSLVGDIMWIGENWDAFALPTEALLDGDLRIGNLETPIDPSSPTDLGDLPLYSFNAPPEMLDGLPFDVLQLNNNHSLDVGEAGLESTLAEVEARGFVPVGVDAHATVEVAGLTIALLSYTWGLNGRGPARAHELFVVPFGHLDEELDLESMRVDIGDASASADTVVVLVHWGFEYEYYADPHFAVIARDLVAAGATLVVGQGPHVVQPAEICHVERADVVPGIGTCSVRGHDGVQRTAAILYSLGNFSTTQSTQALQTGIVATVSLDPDTGDVTGLGWAPVTTVDVEGLRTVLPTDDLDDLARQAEIRRLEDHLGADWRR